MAAQLLYHGLTTGAGVQTLGEEYCDILQVTGMSQLKSCMEGLVNTRKILQLAFMMQCVAQSTAGLAASVIATICKPTCCNLLWLVTVYG